MDVCTLYEAADKVGNTLCMILRILMCYSVLWTGVYDLSRL
jgi:hypothetical protein